MWRERGSEGEREREGGREGGRERERGREERKKIETEIQNQMDRNRQMTDTQKEERR